MILLPEVIENCLKFWNMIEVKEFGLLLRSVYKVLVSISHLSIFQNSSMSTGK